MSPIHIIQALGSEKNKVLEDQKRLAAIKFFKGNGLPKIGKLDPMGHSIIKKDGVY